MGDTDESLYGFGLAALKSEGERIIYDPNAPNVPARRRSRVAALRERPRYLPGRIWWAFFGGTYFD